MCRKAGSPGLHICACDCVAEAVERFTPSSELPGDWLTFVEVALQVLSKVLEDMGDCTGRWEAEVATAEQRVGALGDLLAMLTATMAAHHK